MAPACGLRQEMFELYVPSKWSSNVHNLPRMRSKDALLGLAQSVQDAPGAKLEGLLRASSDEVPNISNQKRVEAQWVYWARDAKERASLASFLEKMPLGDPSIFTVATHEKHASLALVMRQEGLQFGLFVPPAASVDRRNLGSKLNHLWQRTMALQLLRALPATSGLRWGLGEPLPVEQLDDASLADVAHKLANTGEPLFVGLSWTSAHVIADAQTLPQALQDALGPVLALYRFAAWHRSNDAIEAGKQMAEERAEKKRQQAPFSQKDPVRIIGGLFRGQRGTVIDCNDPRGQVKVLVGRMSVLIARDDLAEA